MELSALTEEVVLLNADPQRKIGDSQPDSTALPLLQVPWSLQGPDPQKAREESTIYIAEPNKDKSNQDTTHIPEDSTTFWKPCHQEFSLYITEDPHGWL